MNNILKQKINNSKRAIALEYSLKNHKAPVISHKASDFQAKKIIQIAKKYNIPVIRKEGLSEVLYRIPEGSEIPIRLYKIIASIFNSIRSID